MTFDFSYDNMNLNMKDNILSLNQCRKTPPLTQECFAQSVIQGCFDNTQQRKNKITKRNALGYDLINSCKKQNSVDFELTIYYLADLF